MMVLWPAAVDRAPEAVEVKPTTQRPVALAAADTGETETPVSRPLSIVIGTLTASESADVAMDPV